jgi:hypothetical protein
MPIARYTAGRRTRWQRYVLGFFLSACLVGLAVVAVYWLIPVLTAALAGSAGLLLSQMAITASAFMCVVLASLCAALAVLIYDFFDRMHVPMDRWHNVLINPGSDQPLSSVILIDRWIQEASQRQESLRDLAALSRTDDADTKQQFEHIDSAGLTYLASIHHRLPEHQHSPWIVAVMSNRVRCQGHSASMSGGRHIDFTGKLRNPAQQFMAFLYLSAHGILQSKPESGLHCAGFEGAADIKRLSGSDQKAVVTFITQQSSQHIKGMMCLLWHHLDLPERYIQTDPYWQTMKHLMSCLSGEHQLPVVAPVSALLDLIQIQDWTMFWLRVEDHFSNKSIPQVKAKLKNFIPSMSNRALTSFQSLSPKRPGRQSRQFARVTHACANEDVLDGEKSVIPPQEPADQLQNSNEVGQVPPTKASRRWLWLLTLLITVAAVLLAIYLPLAVSAGTLSHILFAQRCWVTAQSALFAIGVAFAWDAFRQPKASSGEGRLLTQRQLALLLTAVVLSVVVLAVVFAAPAPILAGTFGVLVAHNTSLLMASTIVSAVFLGAWSIDKVVDKDHCWTSGGQAMIPALARAPVATDTVDSNAGQPPNPNHNTTVVACSGTAETVSDEQRVPWMV